MALTASVVATGGVAAALAYSDGAWSAEVEPAAAGSTEQVTPVSPSASESAVAVTDTSPATTSPDTSSTTPSTTVAAAAVPVPTQAASGFADGTYLGSSEYTEWGDVQVEVTISDGAIVDITAVEYPSDRKSSSINGGALPLLEADAVAVQSADLDVVSGATYTSRTYADSLQAALDQAALAQQQEGSSS